MDQYRFFTTFGKDLILDYETLYFRITTNNSTLVIEQIKILNW